ncbi:hypothetical protein [Marinilabilia salmonicolor]|uniref:hypothetical protein n=1 Tax=Marinilabilia salmonicolor TaxID=989 RepID=UPI000299E28B|nr:hypothetical protein [Marinilabilia salmonicolor]
MNLLIPEDKAIEVLSKRITELNDFNFQAKVWKDKVINDLKEIYPLGDTRWLQISGLHFETVIQSEKYSVLQKAKLQAKQLIESYIEQIREYSKIREEKQIIVENNYHQKYSELLNDWNKLVPDYNALLKEKDGLLKRIEFAEEEKREKQNEINGLIENTVQLSNISFSKLFKLLFNLPIGQIVAFFAIIIAIIGGAFKLGMLYSDSISKNEQYELRIERDKLKSENVKLKSDIESKSLKTESNKRLIDSLRNE